MLQKLRREGIPLWATRKPGDAERLAHTACQKKASEIISVGGDGTHHEVVNGIVKSAAAPIFFPITAGTGSDFERAIGKVQLSQPWSHLPVHPVDVGLCRTQKESHYFLNIADFGIGGEVVELVNQSSKKLGGFLTFLLATLQASLTYRPKRIRMTFDAGMEEGEFFNVAVANGSFFGAGMCVAPLASLRDGSLDLILVKSMSKRHGLHFMLKLYRGKHLSLPQVSCFRTKRLTALSFEKVAIDLDGEQKGRLPVLFQVLPSALKLRAPWRRHHASF